MNKNEVIVLIGAGFIGKAIARRIGSGKHIIVGDLKLENTKKVTSEFYDWGFDATAVEVDISSRESVLKLIDIAKSKGKIVNFINAAGVSPSQATVETILKVDLYGTAMLLEEFEKAIEPNGAGVIISSQSGHRLEPLSQKENELLAITETEELLKLDILKVENIKNTLHAYQLSKRCNVLRVASQSVKWGKKGARLNSISPGIIIMPLANDELNGLNGESYKNCWSFARQEGRVLQMKLQMWRSFC